MKKMTPLLLVLILPLLGFTQNNTLSDIDQLIVDWTFNGEYLKADSLLDAQINRNVDNPKYYALKAPFYFYTRYFNPGTLRGDSLIQKMGEYAQKAIEIGKNSEMSLDNQYFVGLSYGYMATFYARQGSYWNAYWAARSCKNYLADVLDEDPTYTDAKMQPAIISYYTGLQFGGFMGFLVWLVGMSGDRTEALQEFHDVAENGRFQKTEARFVLFALYRYIENDYVQAKQIGTAFLEQYPQNLMVRRELPTLGFLTLVEEKGVGFLETEFDSLRTRYHITNPGILNTLGYTLVNQQRLDEAIEVLKINVKLFPAVANGYDSLSEVYLALGNLEMAIHNSRLCLQKLSADSTINADFRQRLREISETRLEELGAGEEKVNI